MIEISPYLKFLLNIFKSNFNLLKVPYKLTFAVTYNCNGHCLTCDIWQRKSSGELNTEEIAGFFSKNNFFSWIDLTGGEITLRDDIFEIAGAIKKHCKDLILLHFPTNALNQKRVIKLCEFIVKLSFPKFIVSISLDGYPQLYEKIRGSQDGCYKAIEVFRELRKMRSKRFDVYFGMTISKYNYKFIDETIEWLKNNIDDFNVSELHLNIAQDSAHFYGKTNNSDYSVARESMNRIRYLSSLKVNRGDPIQYLEKQYLRYMEKYVETEKTPISCEALKSSIFLNPQGNIYACCSDNLLIGNLRDPAVDFDLRRILSSDNSISLKEQIKDGNCIQCWTPCEAYQSILGNLI